MTYSAFDDYHGADANTILHRNASYGDQLNWALLGALALSGSVWLAILSALIG